MADLIKAPINYAVSAGGQFVKGGSVVFGFINIRPDAANPATLKPIYLDSALTSQAANPQGLSSDAVFNQSLNGVLFGADDDSYSVIIYDANDVELSYIPVYELSDATAAANAQAAEAGAITAQSLAEAAQLAAEVAQTAAEASAVAANLSYEEFVNRYLGSYASDPALDPAGNPPIEGSLYWNTTGTPRFKVFTSGVWIYPPDMGLGTASLADLGTAADQVPTNADVRNPRNRIVNPSMAISQENGDATLPVSSGSVYGRDEWFSATNDGAFDVSTESLTGSNSLRLTTTTATTNLTGGRTVFSLVHSMEAQNIFDLNGGDIVVQMALNVNWTGDLSVAFLSGDGLRSYIHNEPVTPSTTSVQFTIPFEAATVSAFDNSLGLRITVGGNNEGSRSTPTVGAWVAGNFVTSDTSTQWTKTINNYVEITNVDLYAGNVPREFQPNSYAYDLAECKRYYNSVGSAMAEDARVNGYAKLANFIGSTLTFPQMRAQPVVSISNPSDFSAQYKNTTTPVIAFSSAPERGLVSVGIDWQTAGVLTAGEGVIVRAVSAGARIFLNARL